MHRAPDNRLSLIALLFALTLLATGCGTLSDVVGPSLSAEPTPIVAEARAPEATPTPTIYFGAPASADSVVTSSPAPPEAVLEAETPSEPPSSASSAPAWVASLPEIAENPTSPPGPSMAPTATGPTVESTDGMAQARETTISEAEPEDYDPWEPYNERMFAFNYNVDRYVLKPAANVYRHTVPEPFQIMISNGFDNIRFPARFVNHVLQGRFWGAFTETSRFVINTIMGVGGLFNPATEYFGIPRSRADFGQTLAKYGVGPGPFFVPPLLPPATVRDFIGRLADAAINPIAWFLIDFWPEGLAIGAGEMVNERAVTYELFQGVEETTLDLYTAVRDGYLRRREQQLRQPQE